MHDAPSRAAMRGEQFSRPRRNGLELRGDNSSAPGRATAHRPDPRALSWRLSAPAIAAIAAAVASTTLEFDLRLADALYAWQGHHWALRWATANEQILHAAGRNISASVWTLVVVAWFAARARPQWRAWRRPLACLALSVLLSTALVAWIKSWSGIDCPWDLIRYGGERAYVDLFSARPAGMPHGGCFPAGHASGGYAWMASYFFFVAMRPAWRWYGLGVGLALGFVFGVSQQMRGAHFLSHDLWTAALCWLTALAVHASARQPLRPATCTGRAYGDRIMAMARP